MNGVISRSPRRRPRFFGLRSLCLTAMIVAFCAHPVRAGFSPESPEVKASIAKGLDYLASSSADDNRIGGKAVVALAFLKNNAPLSHPRVQEAVEAIRNGLSNNSYEGDIYSLGLAIIFLCNADKQQYRSEIERLLAIQGETQKPHGGWGYSYSAQGDTSMTQYSVLSMWEATEAGFDIPIERWEKVANWLIRTQDPKGSFGYQGVDPDSYERVPQIDVRLSMCAAGAGSLYVCSDRFGMVSLGPKNGDDDDLPDALTPVGSDGRRKRRRGATSSVERERMDDARDDADRYLDRNFEIDVPQYVYYYLYALERYQSFREASEGRIGQDSDWYDDGVRFLFKKQQPDGGFQGQCGAGPDTAFAVLFMVRSTRKSITRARYFGGGTLVGGRGLPQGEGGAFVRGGRVKRQRLAGPADELFTAMDDPDNEAYFRALEDLEELSFDGEASALDAFSKKLKKLVADGPPEARVAAVRSLARTRNLDHVPTLIFALEDPDAEVFREAVAGLRFVSRRFTTQHVPTNPTDAQRQDAIREWRQWYLSVRPGAKFDVPQEDS